MKPSEIKNECIELEKLIKETKGRLPAHSVKPEIMMELMAYEDEYEVPFEQTGGLKKILMQQYL